ncbi:MAG: adenosylcobinamide-phosphate synthase CbiB, partial [Lentisphaeraceae bacterium]|nr:adenosylcobinamide-phosphate synthase CbiB [Lentisphaeraceae bacterium]
KLIKNQIYAGASAAISVLLTSGAICFSILYFAAKQHETLYIFVGATLIYFTIAARDLMAHAFRIMKPLNQGDVLAARKQVSMIVGRDTDSLDESQISRATVESVAENTVDGVTSPLFYALVFGPIGAVVYRAINTMDSMFAYKNEKYINFGRIPAYLDDIANYIPARLSGLFICIVACLTNSHKQAWSIMRRDGQKHPSPNSGISEAAVAGALNIQLGGPSTYGGVLSNKQTLGDDEQQISLKHIKQSIIIMYLSSLLFLLLPFFLLFYIKMQ